MQLCGDALNELDRVRACHASAMNVREAIEQLAAAAERVPDGQDVTFRIGLCDGSGTEVSDEIEIDHFARMRQADGAVAEWFVMVKGHPHRDRDAGRSTYWPGLFEGVDEQVQKWKDEDG